MASLHHRLVWAGSVLAGYGAGCYIRALLVPCGASFAADLGCLEPMRQHWHQGLPPARANYIVDACRFTMLHAPGSMQIKNAQAFRALLVVADENGNHLHVRLLLSWMTFSSCLLSWSYTC